MRFFHFLIAVMLASLAAISDLGACSCMRMSGDQPVAARISPPPGFRRAATAPGSFGAYLRKLQLRPGRSRVYLHNGRLKGNQSLHHAVLDIDVGAQDLQQCADAVIRLRAEHLFSTPCADEIQFNFTSGEAAIWKQWRQGMRPRVLGNRVFWNRRAAQDASYENFRRYLDSVFTYAGSASLQQELKAVEDPLQIQIGDVFIQGGFPGHAVIALDVAEDESGARVFLLAQSYMPAQDIHILKSFSEYDPWYRAKSEGVLRTPEWTFDYRLSRLEAISPQPLRDAIAEPLPFCVPLSALCGFSLPGLVGSRPAHAAGGGDYGRSRRQLS